MPDSVQVLYQDFRISLVVVQHAFCHRQLLHGQLFEATLPEPVGGLGGEYEYSLDCVLPGTLLHVFEQSVATPAARLQSVDIAPIATTAYEEAGLSTSAGGRFVSLDDPVMIPANQATWLQPDDIVIGVVQNDDARAYPIKQAAYHHIINDTIGGEPYLVTY